MAIELSPFSAALDFSLDSPKEIQKDEEFTVSISLDSQDTYDVKIFIHNSQDEKVTRGDYVSEVFNPVKDEWQDSWYYIAQAYPDNSQYKLKTSSSEAKSICLRVRKSDSQSTSLTCNDLLILESASSSEQSQDSDQQDAEPSQAQEKKEDSSNLDSEVGEEPPEIIPQIDFPINNAPTQNIVPLSQKEDLNQQPLKLNSDKMSAKSGQEITFYTKKEKTALAIIVFFTLLTILIIIFLSINKL